MNLQELKQKNPAELISEAEKLGIENPSTLRKQEILFAILKKLAEKNEQITATATCLEAGSSNVEATTSPFTDLCMSVTSSGLSSINKTIR